MSDVSGPVSTLPGSIGAGTGMCDEHPERPAVSRIQGETDSFGAEYHDLCAECATAMLAAIKAARAQPHRCYWCGTTATDVRPRRDFEEGMCGPVYDVCGECRKRENDRLKEEWEEARADDYE